MNDFDFDQWERELEPAFVPAHVPPTTPANQTPPARKTCGCECSRGRDCRRCGHEACSWIDFRS